MSTSIAKHTLSNRMLFYRMILTADGRYYKINGLFHNVGGDQINRYPFVILRVHQNWAVAPVWCVHMSNGQIVSDGNLASYSNGTLTVDNTSSAWAAPILVVPEGHFTPT